MMNNFWKGLEQPFFVLAPMEAVTDVVFRHVVARASPPDVYMTEFTSVASFCSPKGIASTRGRLEFTADEQPVVAQIWGTNPEQFATMAKSLKTMGFAGIDINMGCPDKNIIKNGSCSALIENPNLAGELIAAAKEGGLPVSVKTRLGFKTIKTEEWCEFLLRQDLAALTIHGRTQKEMSKVPAHWDEIAKVVTLRDELAPQTLMIGNGDVRDRQHGLDLTKQYGVDGVMIGRGIFHNIFAFAKDDEAAIIGKHLQPERQPTSGLDMASGAKPVSDNMASRNLELLHYHLNLHDKHNNPENPRKFDPLKRFFKVYIRDFPGASELRARLMETKSTDEARRILSDKI